MADSGRVPRFNVPVVHPSDQPARVSIRLDFASGARVGPGKIELLEAIARKGSIAAAARDLGMSYPRAWGLVEALDTAMGEPVVTRAPGGQKGGGAALTPLGRALIERYRQVEAAAQRKAGAPPKA
ncbi:winged helix-turn-helix domain-containing protein [Roseococcus sp. YIM B11640]|uniref:winged helix-turn-helix domain-containing protein n=1 Tax=Roseococcus sp. YIM B11640 TaxID=3133973 RepID=UPI003C7E68B7